MVKEFLSEIIIFEYNDYYLFAALLFFWIFYILSKKIIFWGMNKGLETLLSFAFGGLLFLNIFLFIFIMNEVTEAKEILAYFLQIIGLFGLLLIFGTMIKYIFIKIIRKKA